MSSTNNSSLYSDGNRLLILTGDNINPPTPINPYIVNWIVIFCSRQRRLIAGGKLPINRGVPQGTILGPITFSVMLNDIQAVDSDRSNLVKFVDVLALSVLVKGTQDKTP